jgi:hypothetical protein
MQWLRVWGFWVQMFFPISIYISKFTSLNKAIGMTFFMQLGHTFRHQVNQKKTEEVQSSSFRRLNWSHDFLKEVGPITQEVVYHPWNMYTYLLVYLYNILGGCPFHPSVPSSVLSSIHPSSSSQKKMMEEEEEDDDEWQQQQFIQTC